MVLCLLYLTAEVKHREERVVSGEVKPTAAQVFGMEEEGGDPEVLFDKVCCHGFGGVWGKVV